jgi:hypothetical protein
MDREKPTGGERWAACLAVRRTSRRGLVCYRRKHRYRRRHGRSARQHEGEILAAYEVDGSSAAEYEAMSMYAGVLPGLVVGEDYELAHRIFSAKILAEYVDDDYQTAHWGEDPYNYYDQNTAWFATAMMDGSMSNLREGESVIDWEDKVTE